MNNNLWFKKEKPLLGLLGSGGGSVRLFCSMFNIFLCFDKFSAVPVLNFLKLICNAVLNSQQINNIIMPVVCSPLRILCAIEFILGSFLGPP